MSAKIQTFTRLILERKKLSNLLFNHINSELNEKPIVLSTLTLGGGLYFSAIKIGTPSKHEGHPESKHMN
jgi:hypothetical protein